MQGAQPPQGMDQMMKYLPQLMAMMGYAIKAPAFLFGFFTVFCGIWWCGGSPFVSEHYHGMIFLHLCAFYCVDLMVKHLRLALFEAQRTRRERTQSSAKLRRKLVGAEVNDVGKDLD